MTWKLCDHGVDAPEIPVCDECAAVGRDTMMISINVHIGDADKAELVRVASDAAMMAVADVLGAK